MKTFYYIDKSVPLHINKIQKMISRTTSAFVLIRFKLEIFLYFVYFWLKD